MVHGATITFSIPLLILGVLVAYSAIWLGVGALVFDRSRLAAYRLGRYIGLAACFIGFNHERSSPPLAGLSRRGLGDGPFGGLNGTTIGFASPGQAAEIPNLVTASAFTRVLCRREHRTLTPLRRIRPVFPC